MLKEKYRQHKVSPNKSNLDNVLWLIENCLPQKKDRDLQKKVFINNLETERIKQLSKLASKLSKRLLLTKNNTKISITFGNWALPYLKLLKKE